MSPRSRAALPVPVLLTAAAVGLGLVWVVGASFVPRHVATYVPGFNVLLSDARVVDTATIDARDPDRWRYFAFARGPLVLPDTAGWDLAFRRFHVRLAAGGAALRIDGAAFESVTTAPVAGYLETADRDSVATAFAHWYRYDFLAHLLRPARRTFVVRTAAARYAKLEFLSYYCPGPDPGCVTIRYVYRPDGARRFAEP